MIKIYQKTITDAHLKELEKFRVGSWIYVENPTEKELKELSEQFNLDLGLLRDALDQYEVPRLDVEEQITYIYTRVPHSEDNKVITVPVLLAIGESFLLTVSKEPLSFFKNLTNGKVKFVTTQKTRAFLQIFSEINYSYSNYLIDINRKVRALGLNLEKIKNEDIAQFVNFEGILNDFLAALVPTNTILKTLLSGKYLKLYETDEDLVEDLLQANEQLLVLSRETLTTIVNIRQAYSTIMTNNLNRIIKLFTSLTVILTVPTIISSIYGMNIKLPFEDQPLAFIGVIGLIIIISGLLLWVFNKKEWL